MNRAFLITFALMGLITWAACDSVLNPVMVDKPSFAHTATTTYQTATPATPATLPPHITRFEDVAAGVVCYTDTTLKIMDCVRVK